MARDLRRGFFGQIAAEVFILKAADVVFAAGNGLEQLLIVRIKEIESGERPVIVFGRTGQFSKLVVSRTWIIDGGDEFEIATIRCGEKFAQGWKAVDGLLHGSPFGFSASIAMFYLTVVFEKGDVIDGCLDAEDQRKLVIHFNGNRSHGVFDAGALNADVEAVPHFVLIVTVEFVAEEGGDVFRFYGVDCCACQGVINGGQIGLLFEDDVGGVLNLINAPMIGESKMLVDGTEPAGKFIQLPMETASLPAIGELLSPFPIANFGKSVVDEFVGDLFAAQLHGQPAMTVAVDLQPAGQPSRNAHITEPQFFIHEIKIVVQALALVRFQKGFAGMFVMPWFECRALFHGREDPYQPGMLASFGQHSFDPVFLSEVLLADKLNLDFMICGQFLGILSQLIPEGFGKPRIIKNPYLAFVQPGTHACGKANMRKGSKNQNPVIARENPSDLFRVTLCKKFDAHDEHLTSECPCLVPACPG